MVLHFKEAKHGVICREILFLKPFLFILKLEFERLEVLFVIKEWFRVTPANLSPSLFRRFTCFEPCLGIGSDLHDQAKQRTVELVESALKKLMLLLFPEVPCGEQIRGKRRDYHGESMSGEGLD